MHRNLIAIVVVALLLAACSSDDTTSSDPEVTAVDGASSDLDGLRDRYPLGDDLGIESVVWQFHDGSSDTFLDSIAPPAQDNNPIVEAVLRFDDEPDLQALLATGRAATVPTIPEWYPPAIVSLLVADGDIPVLVSRSVEGLPGIVYTFVQAPDYAVVIYDATIDG